MKQLTKQFALSASALAAALLITACGGGSSTDDTTAPTVTIIDSVADATATGNVTFTFTFSKSVGASFIADDITVTGGDKSTFTMADTGLSATLVVVPTANTTGTVSVTVAADKFKDAGNVVNTASATATQAYNTVTEGTALNFETGGKGAAFTWFAFDNYDAQPAVVDNPSKAGINTSNKVLKFSQNKGAWYTGMKSKHGVGGVGSDLGTTVMTTSNAVLKMKVYKTLISDVGLKLVTESDATFGEVRVANTKVNEWEELTFNFCGKIGANTTVDQLVIFPDFNAQDVQHTNNDVSYVDDITFSACPTTPVQEVVPTLAAPTPAAASGDVISLFSNAYSDVAVDSWNASWSVVGSLTEEKIAGNDTKKYKNLAYVGIEAYGVKAINASTMTHVNFDVWTADAAAFMIKLVNIDASEVKTQHEIAITPTSGAWKTVKLPLSDFTSLGAKANIAQILFSATPAGSATVYVDNIYFSK